MALAPIALSSLEPPLPDPLGHGRAEAAGVVMQVHAPHLDPPAVEQEAAILVVRDGADAERRGDQVDGLRRRPDLRAERVQVGDSSDQSRGDATRSRCSSSTVWPAASENGVSVRATSRPAQSTTTERSTPSRGAP